MKGRAIKLWKITEENIFETIFFKQHVFFQTAQYHIQVLNAQEMNEQMNNKHKLLTSTSGWVETILSEYT